MRTPSVRCFSQTCDIYRATAATSARNETTLPRASSATYSGVPCSLQIERPSESNDLMKETIEEGGTVYLPLSHNGSALTVLIDDYVMLTGATEEYQARGLANNAAGKGALQAFRIERAPYQR